MEEIRHKTGIALRVVEPASGARCAMDYARPKHVGSFMNQQNLHAAGNQLPESRTDHVQALTRASRGVAPGAMTVATLVSCRSGDALVFDGRVKIVRDCLQAVPDQAHFFGQRFIARGFDSSGHPIQKAFPLS